MDAPHRLKGGTAASAAGSETRPPTATWAPKGRCDRPGALRFLPCAGPRRRGKPAPFTGPRQSRSRMASGRSSLTTNENTENLKPGQTLRSRPPHPPEALAELPDVPTISESGLPGFEAISWYCIVAPAGKPIVTRLHTELVKFSTARNSRSPDRRRRRRRNQPRRRN